MDKYLKDIMESGKIYYMNDHRTIITDRMGPWANQDLVLAWEGDGKGSHICVSPDEVEILFKNGLVTNVQRNFWKKLYMESVYADIRTFDGAIVCGILSPRTKLRDGILEYAKRMGYILEHSEPVQMFNGTKSLITNDNSIYTITYEWAEHVKQQFNMELVRHFTRKFFEVEFKERKYRFTQNKFYTNPTFTISETGFSIGNLTEKEVFDRISIDAFREYDIELIGLSYKIDKNILLKAIVQLGFTCFSCPENLTIMYESSIEKPSFEQILPLYQYTPALGKNNNGVKLESGTILYSYSTEYVEENFVYKLEVPYSEGIRNLMSNFETLMKKTYEQDGFRVSFSPYNETVGFYIYKKGIADYYAAQLEKELVILDYAISMYQKLNQLNHHQMFHSIMHFLATDINFPYKEIFNFYYDSVRNSLNTEK